MERAELSHALQAWRCGQPGGRRPEPILISEPDPVRFMTAFADAVAGDSDVFLCDPAWGENERAQVTALLARPPASRVRPPAATGWLMIPTGGTSGRLKFARHDQDTIAAAVDGFTQHFGVPRVNAMGVLPLHHVSGFMAWMRSALTGGAYRPLDWKAVEQGTLPEVPAQPDGWTISLVPTQLERLLRQAPARAWLRQFRLICLGGGPAGPELLEQAAAARLPLSLGYGMTETAAMITALRPEDFLAGARSSGRTMPHGQLALAEDATIVVSGRSVFRGYYPETRAENAFRTTDEGRFDAQGGLLILGRRDEVIITGGEKVNPAEVEAFLRERGGLADVVVVGLPDAEWGQVVVAAYPAKLRPDIDKVLRLIASELAPYKRPKQVLALADWPLSSAGKVNRAEVARRLGESRG